jgi:hypothetical protein
LSNRFIKKLSSRQRALLSIHAFFPIQSAEGK